MLCTRFLHGIVHRDSFSALRFTRVLAKKVCNPKRWRGLVPGSDFQEQIMLYSDAHVLQAAIGARGSSLTPSQ